MVKTTKKSLLMSAISLLLCFSMLIGSTFAWFTDNVSSGNNVIQSGNLDLDVQYTLDGKEWNDLDGAEDLFQKGLWEPGHTEVVALKITNKGSLALKYAASMNIIKETIGKNKDGKDIVLSDILTVSTLTQQTGDIGDAALMLAFMGEGSVAYENTSTFKNSNVLGKDRVLLSGDSHYVFVKVDMAETVGNEANHDGVNIPYIEFGLNVLATQHSHENDSFGNQYDKNATFDDLANTSIFARQVKMLTPGESSVDFELNSNGLTIAKVIVPASAIADTLKPVTVTFDGIDPLKTIAIDENTKAYAYDIDVTNLKDNLSGDQLVTVVVTAPSALAAMNAYHNGTLINNAVYDETEGTITFKTANFSPFAFTTQEYEVSSLADLREKMQIEGAYIKLTSDIAVNLDSSDTTNDCVDSHAYVGSKTYYNGVKIEGKNVALDLNGHSITVECGNESTSNSNVGALFFVAENGSLNITNTGAVSTGFIKMASSIYAVWAPFADPSYVDIYAGSFIADSYAGDPIGTSTDPDSGNGTMAHENSNRALIYAGTGGNMNIYGGYFLYNNTPNDVLDRNNGAFNAKDFYEGDDPFITIHHGVMLINKEYRQNPANTSTPNGSFDNYSIVLAKDCEISKVQQSVSIDGKSYSTWYRVNSLIDVTGITVVANKNAYDVAKNETFSNEDITVTATYSDGTTKQVTDFTITFDDSDFTTLGAHNGTVSYTYDDVTVSGSFVVYSVKTNEVSHSNYTDGCHGLHFDWFSVNNEEIYFPESGSGTKTYDNGLEASYTYASDLVVNNSNAGRVTVNQAQLAPNFSFSGWVGYDVNFNQFGIYVDNVSNLVIYEKFMDAEEAVQNLAGPYAKRFFFDGVDLSEMNLSSGKHTMTFVAIHSDGIQELSTWTLYVNSTEASDVSGKTANVIILAGQSNAYGVSPMTDAIRENVANTDFSNIRIRYTNLGNASTDITVGQWQTVSQSSSTNFTQFEPGVGGPNAMYFGPELAIAQYLATNDSSEVWYIIKYAAAGSLLNGDWYDGTVNRTVTLDGQSTFLATEMLDYVQESLTAIETIHGDNINVRSFMWMQGESEAGDMSGSWATGYDELEQKLVNDIRTNFKSYTTSNNGDDIKFVDAEVAAYKEGTNTWFYSDNGTYSYQGNSFTVTNGVNDQKEANSAVRWDPDTNTVSGNSNPGISNSILFATNTLVTKLEANNENNENDGAHYSSDSMWSLGTWFAEAMFKDVSASVSYTVTVTNNVSGVTGSANPTSANVGETVTITLKQNSFSFSSKSVTVTTPDGSQSVSVPGLSQSTTVTFTMPANNVTVTIS